MNKKEMFVEEIKNLLGINLKYNREHLYNNKRNILYVQVEKQDRLSLLSYLDKHNITHNEHINDYYWIYL